MKRVTLFPLAAALLLAFTPSAGAAIIQTFSATTSPATAGEPANITFDATQTTTEGVKPPQLMSFKVTSPPGAKANLDAVGRCNRGTLETTGRCPSSSQVLSSFTAQVQVDFGGLGTLPVSGGKAYVLEGKGGTGKAVLDVTEPQTGVRALLDVLVQKSGSSVVLSAPNAQLPEILSVVPTVKALHIAVNGKLKKGSGKKAKYLYTNPPTCPAGGWTTTAENTYADGTSQKVTTTQPCKAAKKVSAKKKKKKK